MTVNNKSGGCVCGDIRYKVIGAPLRVTVCHCKWCQRRTGTAFGTEVVYYQDAVQFSGVAPATYRHISDESGRWLDMFFCPHCGTNLGLALEAVPGIRSIPAGTFDDASWVNSSNIKIRHVFTRSRRQWGDISAEVEAYEEHFRQ